MAKMTQISTEIYVQHPEKPGYLKEERKKTVQEVFNELTSMLKEQGIYDELESFSIMMGYDKKGDFPNYRWISCFVVEGGSEGHYIHVDIIAHDVRETLYLGKTFMGIEHALKVSNLCTMSFYR
jgi:hypothetical protein